MVNISQPTQSRKVITVNISQIIKPITESFSNSTVFSTSEVIFSLVRLFLKNRLNRFFGQGFYSKGFIFFMALPEDPCKEYQCNFQPWWHVSPFVRKLEKLVAVRNSLLERFSGKFRRCWKIIPRFSGSTKCYPCQGLDTFQQGKRLLENWPRLRERCWIFSSESATAFLSSSEFGSLEKGCTPQGVSLQWLFALAIVRAIVHALQ